MYHNQRRTNLIHRRQIYCNHEMFHQILPKQQSAEICLPSVAKIIQEKLKGLLQCPRIYLVCWAVAMEAYVLPELTTEYGKVSSWHTASLENCSIRYSMDSSRTMLSPHGS